MATPEALTEAHRVAQAKNAALVAALVLRYWASVRQDDLSTTGRVWIDLVLPAIRSRRAVAGGLAVSYYDQLRRLELPNVAPFTPRIVDRATDAQLRTSLAVTGPIAAQRRLRQLQGPPPGGPGAGSMATRNFARERAQEVAMRTSGATAAAAAVRHVQNAGRDTILGAIKDDSTATGWYRQPKADPCYFCAMLASRGPVYKSDSFDDSDADFVGDGDAKVHDSCGCQMRPLFDGSKGWSSDALRYAAQWKAVTKGFSGQDAVNAFRRAYSTAA